MRTILLASCLTGLLVVVCRTGFAADCTDGNQMQLSQCAAQAAASADRTMNTLYQQLLKKIDPDSQQRLRAAQRAWIVYRDRECLFRTGGGPDQGGSIWPMINAQCLQTLTESRNHDLAAQLKCQSWDLSCPAN
ncbi:Hypothetical protein GbCGDNIH6_7326 [Granulibacter bethesdensis]|uniref:lysozyme inhibitor LprI family protein n=1 Tax=Granulibacter bethesdensis TaxID=364410 RepID=UPI00090B54C4|nr:lysozyme inhibitor LprI family protein [Granulibacter bethesdensis]APH56580.1 Hypothetical protein GbCGDNIH6_7326 [Granulibacter bethesdensis]